MLALRRKQILFPIGIDSIHAYVLLSIYTPFPCTHTSWKVCDFVYDVFFLYPENLDTIKYSKLVTFFILFVQNPTPTRKKLVATALYGNLEIDFTINLNKYFRSYQYFQSCTAFFKKFQHTVKQVQDMPLQCHYTRHIV